MNKVIIVSNTDWYLYNFRRSLAVYLQKSGFEVVLVSPAGQFAEKLQDMGFEWIPWEVGRKTLAPWNELRAIWRVLQIYKRVKPQIVHHHTIKPSIYGSLTARVAGVQAAVNSITGRGYVFLGDGLKVRWLRFIVKMLYRLAFGFQKCYAIFENETDQKYFISSGLIPAERTRLIESVGVDIEQFTPQPEPEGVPIILQASRMLWDKGIGTLVEAARLLHERINVRVVLAGNPDPGNPSSIPETTLLSWQEEGIVEWWGFQPNMNETYHLCHIVAMPSSYAEGVPTVLLEAAACSRPVVTTKIPGCQDFVIDGYNGLLVPPGDHVTLAEALEKLAGDPNLRRSMGAAGRQRVLEKYTTDRVNAATLAVYRELLDF